MLRSLSRTDDSVFSRWLWTVDHRLLAVFMGLIVFGVILVAAASPPVAERIGLDTYHFLFRHLMVLVPTLGLIIGLSFLDVRTIWRISAIILAGAMLAMVMVIFTGSEIKGAQRWIRLPGFSLQPSEFVKPCFAVVVAWLIAYQKTHAGFPGNKICAGLFLVIITLLMLQPDLGMTMVITMVFAAQIFIAGLAFRYLIIFGLGGVGFLVFAYNTFDHVHSRIDRFLNPESGDTYQIEKSLEAFRAGGVFGVGPGQGDVKLNLPDAHADFIFSVAGEELGLLFLLLLVGLYVFILLRGFHLLMKSSCLFSVLAAGGLLVMFGLQTLVHMGSALQLLPAKGMTLPFVSYGGSSLLSTGLAAGMLLSLLRRHTRPAVSTKPTFSVHGETSEEMKFAHDKF
jgi:cell division protein FtsW